MRIILVWLGWVACSHSMFGQSPDLMPDVYPGVTMDELRLAPSSTQLRMAKFHFQFPDTSSYQVKVQGKTCENDFRLSQTNSSFTWCFLRETPRTIFETNELTLQITKEGSNQTMHLKVKDINSAQLFLHEIPFQTGQYQIVAWSPSASTQHNLTISDWKTYKADK